MKMYERQFIFVILILILILTDVAMITVRKNNPSGITDSTKNASLMTKEADWIVYTDGSGYYGVNGTNGMVQFYDSIYLGGADDVIQDCINALQNGIGGQVSVKSGTYYLDHCIQLYRNYSGRWTPISLRGSGMASTTLQVMSGSNCDIIQFNCTGTNSDGLVSVMDMTLKGSTTDYAGSGIVSWAISNGLSCDMFISNVEFLCCAQNGFVCTRGWGVKITNCISEYNMGDGFFLFGQQLYVSNTFVAYNRKCGLNCSQMKYSTLNNLVIDANYMDGIKLNSCQYNSLSSITETQWGVAAAATYSAIKLDSCRNNSFSSVILSGSGQNNSFYGIFAAGKNQNNTFYSLVIQSCTSNPLRILHATDRDNEFYGNWEGTIFNDGSRTVFNGISNNSGMPGLAGAWAGIIKRGVMVWNDQNNKCYIYCNNTWNVLN